MACRVQHSSKSQPRALGPPRWASGLRYLQEGQHCYVLRESHRYAGGRHTRIGSKWVSVLPARPRCDSFGQPRRGDDEAAMVACQHPATRSRKRMPVAFLPAEQ